MTSFFQAIPLLGDTMPTAEAIHADAVSGGVGTSTLMLLLTIFVLAVFVGVEIIAKIPPTLHTPMMSGSNAISGITMIGAILESGKGSGVLATVNVVGGFVVTDRMLSMFKSRKSQSNKTQA